MTTLIEHEGYFIKPHKQFPSSWVVSTTGRGGKVPDILTGMFTSPSVAKNVIDAYLAGRPKKESKDDKTSSEG